MVIFDYQRHRLAVLRDLEEACGRVLRSGVFVLGNETRAIESTLAALVGVEHGIAVSSGTSAIRLALTSLGIGPGDEVVTAAAGFVGTAEAIHATGATPVFADVGHDGLVTPPNVEAVVTHRTKALVCVHLFGSPCQMPALQELCRRRRIFLVEDAAQSILAEYESRPLGAFGDVACFSFFPNKQLGAEADAGLVLTRSAKVAEMCRLHRNHGRQAWDDYTLVTHGNCRVSELAAAVLNAKAPHLRQWIEGRRTAAALYTQLIESRGLPLRIPHRDRPGYQGSHYDFVVQCDNRTTRDALKRFLASSGIETKARYSPCIPNTPAFKALGFGGHFPQAETVGNTFLALPMFNLISRNEVAEVAEHVARFFSGGSNA